MSSPIPPFRMGGCPALSLSVPACMSAILALAIGSADAAIITWIGGNVDWLDGGVTANWSPADEPDADDTATFNTANTVNLGSNNSLIGLTLSGGIDLITNNFDLDVNGLVQLAGASTNLELGGAASVLNADLLTINSGAALELAGGSLNLVEETGESLLDINAGGIFRGNGTVTFGDAPLVITSQWINDGTITALSRSLIVFGAPPVGTLAINDNSTNTRIDLDGVGEAGVVNVNRNQTLDLNIPLSDGFNGSLNLYQNSTFDSISSWTMAGGTLDVDNGFVAGTFPFPDTPAGVAIIDGGTFTLSGGTISVIDGDGTLQIDTAFNLTGGTLSNSGRTIFNGTTLISSATGLVPVISSSVLEIAGTTTLNDVVDNFNWDGPGTASTTVRGSGLFSITANQIDTTDNIYGGALNLNDDGDLTVNVVANEWTLANVLNKNNLGTSVVSGDSMIVSGNVNVPSGTLDLPTVTTQPSAVLNVAGILLLGGASEFGGAAAISGSGLLRMEGTSTVSANTTIATGTFDWDGLGTGTIHTIGSGATFTITSPVLDSDGDMDDPITLAGNGSQLVVSGPAEWTSTAAINANVSTLGLATIGGTSRLILSGAGADLIVSGNTNITAPLTFGSSSAATIAALFTLDATQAVTYSGTTISGAGTYSPGSGNHVTGNSTINAAVVDFDNGSWTIDPGVQLTVNAADYDTTATNAFDGLILLEGGISVTTGDAEFVMDGTLKMTNTGDFGPYWSGEPIDIGNDAGTLDAKIEVSGPGDADFTDPVDFNSDADIEVAAGSMLRFLSGSTVGFNTVNGVNNAEFTGLGEIAFNGIVNVNEAATLNFVGGTVDLDGSDSIGELINIDAPFVINAATLRAFGRINGVGVNTLDINNSVGTGALAVNLDNPSAEWTLNGPAVMNLVNDNTEATLLSGNPVNLIGTVNVVGDVRTTARVDVVGTINLNTVGQPLRLAGGTGLAPNTLQGGVIGGVGLLGADTATALSGFGSINASIDFDGSASLFADNGMLTINQPILDAGFVGTADADGTMNVVSAWNNNVTSGVQLRGGSLVGGTLTNDVGAGISGHGLVSSRVINNTQLSASVGNLLVFQTSGNDNDWDGTTNTGEIEAILADIELRDTATFGFTGTVFAMNGHRAFTSGFALDFNPGSTLSLATGGTYESTQSTDFGGSVNVGVGAPSTIQVANNFFLSFEPTSVTTLNQNLILKNNNIIIEAGATFSGTGALLVPDGSHMVMKAGANANVLLDLGGALRPGNSEGIGQVTVKDYQQASSGELYLEVTGTALNQFDRVTVNGIAVIDGFLNLDMDGGFVPVLGQTFNILSASGGVTGAFSAIDSSGMPDGLIFKINYLPTIVQVEVVAGATFEQWIELFPALAILADRLKTADPDGDGLNNLAEFALDGNPTSSAPNRKVIAKIAPVGGENALTLTFPVRNGPNPFYDPPGGEKLLLGLTNPILHYTVQATDDLVNFPLTVDLVEGADAAAIQAGLPPLNVGWTYVTCRSPGPVAGDPSEFMRLKIHDGPLPSP